MDTLWGHGVWSWSFVVLEFGRWVRSYILYLT